MMKNMLILMAMLSGTVHQQLHGQNNPKGLLLLDPKAYQLLEETPLATRGKLPPSATLEQMFPEASHQGGLGSCTTFAASYSKAYRIFKASDRSKGVGNFKQSPAFIYAALTHQKCDAGTYIHEALQFLKARGSVKWDELPYSDSTCPDWRSVMSLAKNKSTFSYRLSTDKNMVLQQIKQAIADGTPVILGFNACDEFDHPKGGKITVASGKDTSCGAHAVLIVGYDDDAKAIRILNSWGREWGEDGKVWMDYNVFLNRYLQAYVDFGPEEGGWNVNDHDWLSDTTEVPPVKLMAPGTVAKISQQSLVQSIRTRISPKSSGKAEIMGVVKPVRKWSIWLNLSKQDAAQVKSVEYSFHHPSFRNPKKSEQGSSIFISEWLGHGCTHDASISAKLKDGTEVNAKFDFCEVLRNSQAENVSIPLAQLD
ncbi:C1 family peptidase [Duganella sp. HH101]|uniref:C1 family peptidase n=1 Tax=Duganella sp. HH101 TaxID=1781066 RepID=UPI000893C491|nr:C1 family peptidase [Duganella sp. HH101]OFA06261.1 papain family cysteine protease [Duganella sp. HH101]